MSAATSAGPASNPAPLLRRNRLYPPPICSTHLKSPPFYNSPLNPSLYAQISSFYPVQRSPPWRIGAYLSSEGIDGRTHARELPGQLSFDAFLSVAEVLCIVPPAIYSIGCLIGSALPAVAKQFQVSTGSKLFVSQYFLLVGAVVIGSLIRWRQWRRLYCVNERGVSVDLVGRIEKVEENLKSSNTIVRMLSRQLEKLGIRFRVTRKTLKEPISEAAALAQKNSEATRALAMQEDLLEKELREIQNVLLAMQEQQQKQLELILVIGKAGGVLDNDKQEGELEGEKSGDASPVDEEMERKEHGMQSGSAAGSSNDRA